MAETWIVYKADSRNAHDWENRMLLPSRGLTDILAEEWDWSGKLPKVGDRIRDYTNLEDPGNGITHGRDGDWIVNEVQKFSSFDTAGRIVLCICSYSPINAEWERLERGAPVSEMLATLQQR